MVGVTVWVLVVLVVGCSSGGNSTTLSSRLDSELSAEGSRFNSQSRPPEDLLGLSPSAYEQTSCTLLNFNCPYDTIPCDVPKNWQLVNLVNDRYWSVETDATTVASGLEERRTGLLELTFEGVPSQGLGDDSCEGASLITCTVKSSEPGDPSQLEGICRADFSGTCSAMVGVSEQSEPGRYPMTCFTLMRTEFALKSLLQD